MERLDDLVAQHLEERLLDPARLEEVLSIVLDRRQERAERRAEHATELRKKAAEAEARLKRRYDAIESAPNIRRCRTPTATRTGRRIPPRSPPRAGPAGRGREWRSQDHGITGQPAAHLGRRRRRKIGGWRRAQLCSELAERVGFEPTIELPLFRFSRPAHSTTLAPLRATARQLFRFWLRPLRLT